MYSESLASVEDELSLFYRTLIQNHFQEITTQSQIQLQFIQDMHRLHQREMASISMLFNPFDWARTIRRYTRQLLEVSAKHKLEANRMRAGHEQAIRKIEKLIAKQKLFLLEAQRTDAVVLERCEELLDWSLSHRQRHYFRQALWSGYALIVTDEVQSIVWVSDAFEAMTGYGPEEVVGRNPRFLQGALTDQASVQHLRNHLVQGYRAEAVLANYRKNGQCYQCHLRIAPVLNHEDELTHFVAIINEVKTHR